MMNTRKIIWIIIAAALLVAVFFVIAYYTNSPAIDGFLSDELKEERRLERAGAYFPDTIGSYTLFGEPSKRVEIENMCNPIEKNPILQATGRTGNACMETFVAEYREPVASTTSIIRVHLSRFTEAPDLLKLLIEKSTSPDTLGGQPIFRLAPFQIGWSPRSGFDFIVVDEGTATFTAKSESYGYSGTATGDNDVTKYFISEYRPGE